MPQLLWWHLDEVGASWFYFMFFLLRPFRLMPLSASDETGCPKMNTVYPPISPLCDLSYCAIVASLNNYQGNSFHQRKNNHDLQGSSRARSFTFKWFEISNSNSGYPFYPISKLFSSRRAPIRADRAMARPIQIAGSVGRLGRHWWLHV